MTPKEYTTEELRAAWRDGARNTPLQHAAPLLGQIEALREAKTPALPTEAQERPLQSLAKHCRMEAARWASIFDALASNDSSSPDSVVEAALKVKQWEEWQTACEEAEQ
jgi:hypothetical protein